MSDVGGSFFGSLEPHLRKRFSDLIEQGVARIIHAQDGSELLEIKCEDNRLRAFSITEQGALRSEDHPDWS